MEQIEDDFGLTQKQRVYVERLIVDFDEKAAAAEAGYDPSMIVSLRTNPLVKLATEALSRRRIKKMKMSQEEAEIHLKKMAEPIFSDFYEQDPSSGKFRVRKNISEDKLAAIKEIRTAADGSQTIVFHNKETLVDKVMRRHGAYVNRHQIEGKIDHNHTHELTAHNLIEEMELLLKKRPKQEAIDVEYTDAVISRREDG